MQEIEQLMKQKAKELLDNGTVTRVIGWRAGDFYYDNSPATFTKENIDELVYNYFCGANLSKYLIEESKKEGKILVFLKPCDTYSYNQLVAEHKLKVENIYVVGIECQGKLDINRIEALGYSQITNAKSDGENVILTTSSGDVSIHKDDVLLSKCYTCKSKVFAYADETIVLHEMKDHADRRFKEVEKLEKMTPEERYHFWQEQLSKCIRCNACRNVCPACTCFNCVFDNINSGVASKSNDDSFEEKCFHIIRSFHVAGRCTDCGECSRVCPEHIPLHLLNRKYILDINRNYGEYQAGSNQEENNPLTSFNKNDVEAAQVVKEGK